MLQQTINEANQTALGRVQDADPVLVGILPAGDAIPELKEGNLLHAGPPIAWPRMCGPMKGAIVGALRYEQWAGTEAEAESMAERGAISFHPAHDFGAVGPMTGIISPFHAGVRG